MTKLIGLGLAGLAISAPMVYTIPAVHAQTVPTEVREAFSLLSQGRVQDAIAAFEAAVRRYPDSLDAKLGLAIAQRLAQLHGGELTIESIPGKETTVSVSLAGK